LNPTWSVRTGRLDLRPVCFDDLDGLAALKADPLAFGLLLGGVRDRQRTAQDLAEDIVFWGEHGVGMWSIRERGQPDLIGLTGIMQRPDGRGMALRFALQPWARGRGYASEAALAALRYAHEHGRLARVVAVARETNTASRELLAAIGMTFHGTFIQHGWRMWLFESLAPQPESLPVKTPAAALVPA
jgi:RimJ/RimL family protein N-acetyltransferase